MIRFLKTLLHTLIGSSAEEQVVVGSVASTELITRYVLNKRQFSVLNKRIKPAAFLPPPNLQMSVYRTEAIDESAIWDIGTKYVAEPQDKVLCARGDLSAEKFADFGLEIVPDVRPHPLHANVEGWPTEKDKQKMIAVELANAADPRFPSAA